jgi:Flp pilus assembly protein TadG
MKKRLFGARGAALVETAVTLPLILFVAVGIFEFGRAYQTWQVLTNAAREGARVAILPNETTSDVQTRVRNYMSAGQLPHYDTAGVDVSPTTISIGATTAAASRVTVTYPFEFMVLQPVARLVVGNGTDLGAPFTMTASAEMRDEQQ